MKGKSLTKLVFIIYLVLLVWLILFKLAFRMEDIPRMRNVNWIPFAQSALRNGKIDYSEIGYNALVFVPFGVYLMLLFPKLSLWKKIGLAAGLSLLFESIQYLFAIGASDLTDVLSNTIGAGVGLLLFFAVKGFCGEKTERIFNIFGLTVEGLAIGLWRLLWWANR